MFIWKIAPAFVCGNCVVIKSAETTPLNALYICGLIKEAGFPPGTINLVSGYGKTVGAAIASHMNIDKVAFTGSTATGRAVLRAAANSNLKKVTLELGGKSPNIVFPDADLEKAVAWSAWGINMNYGQTCHAGTRIYVHEDIYDKFTSLFTARMKQVKIGDNFDPDTDQGPQNSKMQHDKIKDYLEVGRAEGATVALGGKAHEHPSGAGYFIEPTIFTDVTPDMKIVKEEIFGPVVTVTKFKDEQEVIKLANDTSYGLAAGVHTNDYQRAIRVTNKLKAGTTWVNMFNFVSWSIPFGGYKVRLSSSWCYEFVADIVYRRAASVESVARRRWRITQRQRRCSSTWGWRRRVDRICSFMLEIVLTKITCNLLESLTSDWMAEATLRGARSVSG
jgi:aldehyde dehydrogenase (NAD+)